MCRQPFWSTGRDSPVLQIVHARVSLKVPSTHAQLDHECEGLSSFAPHRRQRLASRHACGALHSDHLCSNHLQRSAIPMVAYHTCKKLMLQRGLTVALHEDCDGCLCRHELRHADRCLSSTGSIGDRRGVAEFAGARMMPLSTSCTRSCHALLRRCGILAPGARRPSDRHPPREDRTARSMPESPPCMAAQRRPLALRHPRRHRQRCAPPDARSDQSSTSSPMR